MKTKTSELTGAALDWAVARCEGMEVFTATQMGFLPQGNYLYAGSSDMIGPVLWLPDTDWAQGGPIIEREGITIEKFKNGARWCAFKFDTGDCEIAAGTPLIAAMRCYVASKLGDEVDVPDELCE